MSVGLFTHPACLDHDPGPGHPESPARLRAVLAALEGPGFAGLQRHEASRAQPEAIGLVHAPAYVARLIAAAPGPGEWLTLDPDTHISAGSIEAALRAAGGVMDAVDAVLAGRIRHGFVATRPPGHHAEPARAMGFCLFNAVAVGAAHARRAHGLARVAIIDFDVHHGNGTQAMAWSDEGLFYGSTHQMPLYPGTGAALERGQFGTIVNRPLAAGAGAAEYRAALGAVLAEMARFAPELVLVSAGFDAHRADPLAGLMLEAEDFAWTAHTLAEAAGGRMVAVLEGGYDLSALAESAAAFVGALLEHDAAHG